MRILHVTHLYRPALGGAEQHITDQSEELARRGHQVDVYTAHSTDYHTWQNDDHLPYAERLDHVNVHRFDAFQRGPAAWKLLNRGLNGYWRTQSARYIPLIIWGNGPVSLSMIWALLRHGRQYDLIHVNSLHYAPVSYTYWIAKRLGVPYALTPFVHIDQPVIFDVKFQNAILRNADLVLVMTVKEKEYLMERDVQPERIAVAGVGLHLERYPLLDAQACRQQLNLPASGFLLLFMGRKERYKGLHTVLAACERLQADRPDLYLIAVGPETADSQQLRQQFAHVPRVIYYDRIADELKPLFFNACDALILPSQGESFGIVYTEAWAVKKPVIGSTSGAIPGLISEDIDGLLVRPDDPDDTADKIMRLYQDAALRQKMGEAGYAKVTSRYLVQRVADSIEAAYVRTIRRHRTGRRMAAAPYR